MLLIALAVFGALTLAAIAFGATHLRVVVPTNSVHIVQSSKRTTSYGKDLQHGNSYYRWPAYLPVIGVTVITLPTSVFSQKLEAYSAYDKDRLPFHLDVTAFFRITDSNVAAQRVQNIEELHHQLDFILRGAVRTILATADIQTILEARAAFGQKFTDEVDKELTEWGIQNVNTIALMDIRDEPGSQVIANIMAKQQSQIEMESRKIVASNRQAAAIAEVDAARAVETQKQTAAELVGIRTAEQQKAVGIAGEQAKQAIAEQAAITATKDMAVKQVDAVRTAEIDRDVAIVDAERDRKAQVIDAERDKAVAITKAEGQKQQAITLAQGEKEQAILVADGKLGAQQRNAQGIQAEGLARAEAEKALQLAPVAAQISLAKEIGSNDGYQTYLIKIRQIEAGQAVGIEQAKALSNADVKVISNTGTPTEGMSNVMDLFSAKGGQQVGAMLSALANNPDSGELLGKFLPQAQVEPKQRPNNGKAQ